MDSTKGNRMANRFQANQYALATAFITERDGNHCLICGRSGDRISLQIDHADNDLTNFNPDNLHLMCGRCNCTKRQMTVAEQKRHVKKYSAKNEREREDQRNIGNKHNPGRGRLQIRIHRNASIIIFWTTIQGMDLADDYHKWIHPKTWSGEQWRGICWMFIHSIKTVFGQNGVRHGCVARNTQWNGNGCDWI